MDIRAMEDLLYDWSFGADEINNDLAQPELVEENWEPSVMAIDFQQTDLTEREAALMPQSSNQESLQKATSKASVRSRKQTSCPICGLGLLKRTLNRHIRTFHRQGQSHKCLDCNRAFPRKDALDRHQREQHSGDCTVECIECGKVVKERSLESHFKSRKCQCRRYCKRENVSELTANNTDSTARATVPKKAAQETKAGCSVFQQVGTESMCDPLLACIYLGCITLLRSHALDYGPSVTSAISEGECLHLRGVTIRAIAKSLSDGRIDDHLDGAIRTLDAIDYFHDYAAGAHDAAVRWMQSKRGHRASNVMATLRSAISHLHLKFVLT